MKVGRIVMIVIGSLLALIGFGLLAGATAGLIAHATQRTDGFFQTGEVRLASATYAITSDRVDLESEPGESDWLVDRGALGTVRLTIDPGRPTPIFAGIGPTADVARYLDGVPHDAIRDFELSPDRVTYRRVPGEAAPEPPEEQEFWVAQVTTEQRDALTWEVESGDWTVVVMNADGSRGVDTDARLGIKVDWLLPALIGLLVAGVVFLAGGATLDHRRWPRPVPAGRAGHRPDTGRVAGSRGTGGGAHRPRRRGGPTDSAGVPVATHRSARCRPQPRSVAGQVAAGDPALHRVVLPVDRLRRRDVHRLLRHPLHRALSPGPVRLQRRRAAVELAGRLLLLQHARNRPLPALQPALSRLPRRPQRAVPGAALAWAGARQVVAAGDPPVPAARCLRGRLVGSAGRSSPTPSGPAAFPA